MNVRLQKYHFRQAREILLRYFSFRRRDPVEAFVFYRDTSEFGWIFAILTIPSILENNKLLDG